MAADPGDIKGITHPPDANDVLVGTGYEVSEWNYYESFWSFSYSFKDNSNSSCKNPEKIAAATTVYLWSLVFLFFVSIIGNGSMILLFLRVRKLRDINNAFIFNMAIGDILYTTVFIPIEIYKEFYTFRPLGKFFCYFSISINYTSQDVSIFSLVALSILRFRVVVLPLRLPPERRKFIMWLGCVTIWVTSFCLAFSAATKCIELQSHDCVTDRPIKTHMLAMSSDFFNYYVPFQFVILFFIPLVAISMMYGAMAYKLTCARTPRSSDNGAMRNSRRRLAITVLLLVIIFAICWFPHHIRLLIVQFQSDERPVFSMQSKLILRNVQFFLTMLSSVLNPFILHLVFPSFKRHFVATFCPRFKPRGWSRVSTNLVTLRYTWRSLSNRPRSSSRCHTQPVTAL